MKNNFRFKLRESCRQIDDRKWHCIGLIQCHVRSSIFGALTPPNRKVFSIFGMNRFFVWVSLISLPILGVEGSTNPFTWSGTTSVNWATPTNWGSSLTAPNGSSDVALFVSPTAPGFQPNLLGNPYTVVSVQFESGSSPITIAGTGAGSLLTFQAASGSASISAASASNVISSPMQLSSNLSTVVSASVTLTLSGAISGSSVLTTGGAGTTLLSNPTSSYSGGTVASAGILQVTSDGALGLATGSVTISSATFQAGVGLASTNASRGFILNGAATIDTNGQTLTIPGVISGDSLTVIASGGAGVLALQGANLYTAGTTVSQGTLNIQNDGNLGASSGSLTFSGGTTLQAGGVFDISSNRIVTLNVSVTVDTNGYGAVSPFPTISANISGSGSLEKINAGTLSLLGNNSYAGPTTISGGTLLGNSVSLQGQINDNAALIFNQTFAGTFSGSLQGTGSLQIQGGGPLTMTGNSSTFSGATNLVGSQLIMNGNLSGSSLVTVDASSTLSGSGSVGAISNSGVIQPGNAGQGTLSVAGNAVFNAGSFFIAELEPLSSGLLQVSGTATLTNGLLQIQPNTNSNFFGVTSTYTIINAGSLGGTTFSSFFVTDPNFSVTPVYSLGSVQLFVSVLNPFLGFPFGNANERAVGNNIAELNELGLLSADMEFVVDSLAGQSIATVNDALDQMHPAALSAFAELQTELGGQLLSLFHRTPMLSCSCREANRFWVEPFGNWLKEKKQGMEIGFNGTTRGVAFGYDHQFFNCWTLGIGGAWNATDLKWEQDRGAAYIDGLYGSLYTDVVLDHFYLGASCYAGKDWYDTMRHIQFTTIDRQAKSHSHSLDLAGQLTAAYFFGMPSCLLYPYATVDYLYLKNSSFAESGAISLDLTVDEYTSSTLRAEAGGAWRFSDRNRDSTICISPIISMGYVLEFPLQRSHYNSTFAGQSIPFRTKGWDMAWQLLNLRFGLAITYRCLTLDSQYSADISPEGDTPFFNQRANFRFSYSF